MQSNGKTSPLRANGAKQEWGAKARKNESGYFRGAQKRKAITESKDDA